MYSKMRGITVKDFYVCLYLTLPWKNDKFYIGSPILNTIVTTEVTMLNFSFFFSMFLLTSLSHPDSFVVIKHVTNKLNKNLKC